ncbi:AAA domain-containing protein [Candidatus Thiosymbion oneisti]|uniref:AAA domain-containing protein n=1 Tax=Candidatus Thiosymbion oneisti TaxID=589554 RepID=UPI000B0CD3DD|nr:AAA domain-containing protein [Candidatus Thiosymbion oneisti]
MAYIKNITRYFKQSLIDAERLCPDDKDLLPVLGLVKSQSPTAAYIAVDNRIWLAGRIDITLAEQIIDSKKTKDKPPLREAELVLFPRVDLFRYQGGWGTNRKRRVLLPLVVFVRLQADGQLRPTSKAPWIPREWLAPNQSVTQPFSEFTVVDSFLTQQPFEGIETWSQLVAYCTALLCAAAGTPYIPADTEASHPGTSLFEFEVHPEYELNQQCLLQTETAVVGAKDRILKVLDALLDTRTLPPLYQRFCAEVSPELQPNQDLQHDKATAKVHLGQMTGEFPLSPKQRNALHHFLKQEECEILAVNGPPGTGKTTLLRSVVASLWSQAALEEKEPPLIVATSNNNQAVTNILESFAKVDEEGLDENLQGRWVPEVASYGLYCCASNKANEKNPYMYLGPRGEGCMKKWQTQDYLNSATEHFIEKAGLWRTEPVADVAQVKKQLHQALRQTQQAIITGIDCLAAFQGIEQEIVDSYGSVESLLKEIASTEQLYDTSETEYTKLKSQLDELYLLWEGRSIWIRLLLWLPSIRKEEYRKTARLLNRWDLHLEDHADAAVEAWLTTRIRQHKAKLDATQRKLSKLHKYRDVYGGAKASLTYWIEQHQPPKLFTKALADQVSEINDRVLRFKLFKLASHYWEARWLLELKEFFANDDSDKKSPTKVLRKLRRFSKLTPCFVSTFYMVPSTFMAGAFQDGTWTDIPLFNEIDLLIVDEAGQALPEVSAASFALTKRALIVGDTDQIEPVWSVPASVDRANLKLFDLLDNEQQYDDFWLQSGLLASSGNIMRVAQRQCHYHQFGELQRGLYLTEHRRCYDSIVSYCNTLVYKGILEPLRGEPKAAVPWGTMSMIPVSEASKPYGGSRGNPGEARQIAQWLSKERNKILDYARNTNPKWADKDDTEVLKLAVGIVTPFNKQAVLIRTELKEEGISGLTVGTVHSLQGDERLIVIFSSVYGENDRSVGKFYDNGPNMLNVAVSRAKDAFLVFGHPDVFGATDAGTPSGILRSRLGQLKELKN